MAEYISMDCLWKCESCFYHRSGKCSTGVWCENGESYRPDYSKLQVVAIEAEPVKQWVSIAHEKPKCRGHYFIAYKFQGSDMRFFGEAFWHDDIPDNGYVKGDHFSNEGVDGMYVTHWMEIPKLPNCGAKMTEE